MKYDYFISSRYRNKDQVLELARKIRQKGKSVYCFVESQASITHVGKIDEETEKAISKFEAIENWQKDPRVRDVFETDMKAMTNSRTIILLLPAGKSSHIEAGVGYGLRKKMILIGEQKETESLYLIFSEFYRDTISFLKTIKG